MTVEAVARGTLTSTTPGSTYDFSVPTPPWLIPGETRPCDGADPETFFPDGYGLRFKEQIDEAKALCLTCPVRERCLAWALIRPDLDGVWAATTPPERRRIRTGKRLPSDTI